MKYRPDRNRWEIYISPTKELGLYNYCWDSFGAPGLDNGWDQHGGWYMFTNNEYVTILKLRFGI